MAVEQLTQLGCRIEIQEPCTGQQKYSTSQQACLSTPTISQINPFGENTATFELIMHLFFFNRFLENFKQK
jgi:hypothetical protein